MNTGCEFFEDGLAEYAAGRLAGERMRAVADHLEACEDCRGLLATIHAVRRADVDVPVGLEARIRAAVHEVVDGAPEPRLELGSRVAPRPSWSRPSWSLSPSRWMVPLTAAAALALVWVGIGEYRDGVGDGAGSADPAVAAEEYAPYGAWPATEMVAGDPLLSELSLEDLERLLEEMES